MFVNVIARLGNRQNIKQTLGIGVELLSSIFAIASASKVNKLSQRLGISYNKYINPLVPGPEDKTNYPRT